MFNRVSRAIQSGRRAVAQSEIPQLEPSHALIFLGREDQFETALSDHLTQCRKAKARPVLIAHRYSQILFDTPQVIFENIPLASELYGIHQEAPDIAFDHIYSRIELIFGFWNVEHCTWIGVQGHDLLERVPTWAHEILCIKNVPA